MTQERMSADEAGQLGMRLYDDGIRAVVETDENIGKLIVIDVETGEYEIDVDRNSIAMTKRMLAKRPNAELIQLRIGYGAVHAFGGFRLMPSKR